MAERKKAQDKEKETKGTSSSKKIATGSTKKIVEKRSSSVAAKKQTSTPKKETEKSKSTAKGTKVTNKKGASKTTTKKTDTAKSTGRTTTKKSTTKKETAKKTTTASKKKSSIDEILEEETKEVFNSIVKATGQDMEKVIENKPKTSREYDKTILEDKKEITTRAKNEQKLSLKEMAQIEETVIKEMKANKRMPELELKKMISRIFQNILFAIVVMAYFNFIILGFINIENGVFLTDLKVFSIAVLVISVVMIEIGYKKKSGKIAIHGIETLVLSFLTMGLIYVNLTWANKFIPIAVLLAYIYAIYYVVKATIIYRKMKKRYFVESMKEIIRR